MAGRISRTSQRAPSRVPCFFSPRWHQPLLPHLPHPSLPRGQSLHRIERPAEGESKSGMVVNPLTLLQERQCASIYTALDAGNASVSGCRGAGRKVTVR